MSDHSVEVVSDSGEGAQTCGQMFGAVTAKMGNGVRTVEIIPAEIETPARTPAGAPRESRMRSLTVEADRCMTADAAATALFGSST